MSAPQFTPGPWMAAASPSSVVGWPVVQQGRGRSICSVSYLPRAANAEVYAESEANARLISAAPKMHAALAAFEEQWNACGGNSHFGGLFQNVRDLAVDALAEADANHWLNTSRKQLAKARGDQ